MYSKESNYTDKGSKTILPEKWSKTLAMLIIQGGKSLRYNRVPVLQYLRNCHNQEKTGRITSVQYKTSSKTGSSEQKGLHRGRIQLLTRKIFLMELHKYNVNCLCRNEFPISDAFQHILRRRFKNDYILEVPASLVLSLFQMLSFWTEKQGTWQVAPLSPLNKLRPARGLWRKPAQYRSWREVARPEVQV